MTVSNVPAAAPRQLTPQELEKVRDLLETNFGKDGIYRNGYSDQRIGTELNVPWAAVAAVRNVAWGPIKQDPAVTAIEDELRTIRDLIDEKVGGLGALEARLLKAESDLTAVKKKYQA